MKGMVKGGFRKTLPIGIRNFDLADAESIEFVFKQKMKRSADVIKTAVWVNGAETADVYTVDGVNGVIFVRFSQEDTGKFKPGSPLFFDTRINVKDSYDNPDTPIKSIPADFTLFEDGDNV